jgi:hypothetical protein
MAYNFQCDWKSGFVMDPTKKQRVGYLTAFKGLDLGEFLKPDITVYTPYNAGAPAYSKLAVAEDKVTVVGVLESFSWGGGVGDPVCISAYISAENAFELKAKLKMTLKTTKVTNLGWWLGNFDEETKEWFEESFPKAPEEITGQVNAPGKTDIRIMVADEATKVAPNIDANVYNLYFEVVPATNQTADFHFATSKAKQFIKRWGLVVGTQASAALPPST